MAGKRARAFEDLRVSRAGGDKAKKPPLLNMLFAGGSVERPLATDDLRMGRREGIRPRTMAMLFAGGKTRSLAREDIRMGAPGEGSDKPQNLKMLADGGEADDEDYEGDEIQVSDALVMATQDFLDCLTGYYGPSVSESDSKVERASKDAARKARAEIAAKAFKAMVMLADED